MPYKYKSSTGYKPKTTAGYKSKSSTGYKPKTTAGYKPKTTAGYKPKTTAGYKPKTTAGYKPKSSTGYKPKTTAGYKPKTTAGYKPKTTAGYKPKSSTGYKSKKDAYCYSLNCVNGKKYVGFTTNLDKRLNDHFSGNGSKATQKHRPVSINHIQKCKNEDNAKKAERIVYQKMSDYHGIENVRGAGHTSSINF